MTTIRSPRTLARHDKQVKYPESDGKPLGETGVHVEVIIGMVDVLWRHYDDELDIAVLSNMFLYYVQGDPRRNVCPDVFVTKGIPSNRRRRTFKVWEEGKAPDLAIEVTSRKTRKEDQHDKFELYRDVLKIKEYFLFDPLEEYLEPSLQGFRLVRGQYKPIAPVAGRLPSKVLGFHLERDDVDLRFHDPRTGLWLPTGREIQRLLRASKTAERREKLARRQAEAEAERLRQEIASLRKRRSDKS